MGHQVAVHGYRHRPFPLEAPAALHAQLDYTQQLLAPLESLGRWGRWSRRFPGPLSLPALPPLPVQRSHPDHDARPSAGLDAARGPNSR